MASHTRTRTGCWTCREAGYKCDEQKPHCGRCVRLNKECKGYGIRLRWRNATVSTTGKRLLGAKRGKSVDGNPISSPVSVSSPFSMSSVPSAPPDVDGSAAFSPQDVTLIPASMTGFLPDLAPGDQRLLHYWTENLSCLISVAPRKGRPSPFQLHLASMSYQHSALRSTVLSMAANHLSLVSGDSSLRISAFRHQQDAIRLLQHIIQDPSLADYEPALATVMMMQVSARLFGDEEGPYVANHLIGANAMILRRGGLAAWRTSSTARFLLSLFAYHDILSSVSRGSSPLIDHTPEFTAVEGTQSMEGIAQVLHVVARISALQAQARVERTTSSHQGLSEPLFALGSEIQQVLLAMNFTNEADDETDRDIKLTAEAYRHAAFIYLYRVWLDIGAPNPNTLGHVQQCISCIEQVPNDSPLASAHMWPLFTAGCEAVDSAQRMFVQSRFAAMYSSRKFPSLKRVMRDIEVVWATKDMEQLTNGLDKMSKVDCIQVILRRRGREVDFA